TGFLKILRNPSATGGVRNVFGLDARPRYIGRDDAIDGLRTSVRFIAQIGASISESGAPPQRHRPRRASRSAISLKEGARQTRNALASLVIKSLPSGEKVM